MQMYVGIYRGTCHNTIIAFGDGATQYCNYSVPRLLLFPNSFWTSIPASLFPYLRKEREENCVQSGRHRLVLSFLLTDGWEKENGMNMVKGDREL